VVNFDVYVYVYKQKNEDIRSILVYV
jgi:hypothetical protein